MTVIEPKKRRQPYSTARTHARLRHDYATWHDDHQEEALDAETVALPFADRSKFDSSQIIAEAIVRSYEHPAIVARNGNHVVTFDMGYLVGFDARAQRRTSGVTVVIKPSGEVITVHPGTSWSKDQTET